ncbi:TreTu family toxin [Nocardioides acrostichi]
MDQFEHADPSATSDARSAQAQTSVGPENWGRAAAKTGDDLTRVGRWMGDDELLKMQRSGQVQVGGGGTTHVADPANMATYARQAAPGSKYVEFDVPRTSLFPSGWPGGAQIPGPNHILARLAERRGSPVQFPVPACNIVVVGSC